MGLKNCCESEGGRLERKEVIIDVDTWNCHNESNVSDWKLWEWIAGNGGDNEIIKRAG